MNFKKANKNKQQEIKIAVEKSTKTAKETLGKIVLSISIAILAFTMVNISDEKDKSTLTEIAIVTTSEEYCETGITTTSNTTTTTTVTTTTAKAVTTTPVTTSVIVATTEEVTESVGVPATERSVVIEVVEERYEEPIYEEPKVEEIVEFDPRPEEPIIEEPQDDPKRTQEYYSDDGDCGWSHVSVRYTTPSLDADKERYHAALDYVTEEERIYLINIVASEYGSDWISVSEKAKIVAVVMNRVNENYNGKTTIYDVLTDYGQFQGYSPQSWFYRSTTPTCIDAVDYYFLHKDEWQYQGIKYISGHGSYNTFS